jgi:hypothetical protein
MDLIRVESFEKKGSSHSGVYPTRDQKEYLLVSHPLPDTFAHIKDILFHGPLCLGTANL